MINWLAIGKVSTAHPTINITASLFSSPDSRFPIPHLPISPHSLFPIPYSLLPTPYSLLPKTIKLN
ncbi:MAG: hypothetical protein F6J94_31890 [Moorea sp. SIO1F2]|uniref:hypothetical protein n=1 Tax=Moorena sp. SIO1F2 TaxID=2607819 RepID=UPI0013B7ABFB|nr:hypothetical protein [Moorena sp. SIO1F2]NET86304.1 hypothetical protein [Moorena sp. SIO1F2]